MSSRSSWTSEMTAVSASTLISSGQATISSSALGTRSRVASPERGSTTTVCQPSGRASAQPVFAQHDPSRDAAVLADEDAGGEFLADVPREVCGEL